MPLVREALRGFRERVVSIQEGQVIRDQPVDLLSLGFSSALQREVSAETALTVSALWRGWKLLAGISAAMPLHVYQDGEGGRRRIALESEAYIWRKPNPEVNRFVFWSTVFLQYFVHGNGFIYVGSVPDAPRRRPVEMWPVDPRRVAVGRDRDGRKQYIIDGTVPERDWLAGGNIVHLQGIGTDGLRGLSPLRQFAESIGLAKAGERYSAAFMGNASAPGGYLSTEADITPEQAKAVSDAWEANHRGVANAGRLAVIGKGVKWNSTAFNPEDAQLLAQRSFQVAEAARITGVPEHLLGSHDKQSSWGTGIAEQNRGLLVYTLDQELVNVELTISEELLMVSNHYAKFSREGLLRGDPVQRADFYSKLVALGVLSPNEIRTLEDMEGIGPEGDIRLRPANFVPLDAPAPAGYGNAPAAGG